MRGMARPGGGLALARLGVDRGLDVQQLHVEPALDVGAHDDRIAAGIVQSVGAVLVATARDHLQALRAGQFAAAVEAEIERDLGLGLGRCEAAERQGEHVHRVTRLETRRGGHEGGLAAGVETQRIIGAQNPKVIGISRRERDRLHADIGAEELRGIEDGAIIGNRRRVDGGRHEQLDEGTVARAVGCGVVEGQGLGEVLAEQDLGRTRKRDDGRRRVEHGVVGRHCRIAERRARIDGAGRALQRPVAAQGRKTRRVGRGRDTNTRQGMQVVHERCARRAGADIAAPELDLGIVGEAVAPAGDVLRPRVQNGVVHRRRAELDLAGLAVGQEVDLLEAVQTIERLGDLRDAVERRIDHDDLGVRPHAVGQLAPARDARVDEQHGIDRRP